jgi:anti-sigma regulatory factor (Ser/Thr protein kinase)
VTLSTRIDDPSQAAEARRNARKLAAEAGFDEASAEKVSIVVSEAGTNVLKHAGGGQLLLRVLDSGDRTEIEVLVLDSGPGMTDPEACRRDGYSTAGTYGDGLGAIARLSRYCDLYSMPGRGTALLARVAQSANGHGFERFAGAADEVGVVQVPKPGEEVCGDQWGVQTSGEHKTLLLADGLGHGPDAAKAANSAIATLERQPDLAPGDLIEAVHLALRSSRGAAVAAARLDGERRLVTFAGLGNISAKVAAPGEPDRHMVSINGTAGVEARTIREFSYPWPEGSLVILHSDGIATHWGLASYPGLAAHHPGVIAGVVYRDHARRNDDATIVISK